MLNMNSAVLAGYVGAAPTLQTWNGKHKLTLRMATSEIWHDERGEKREKTDWHEIVFWGRSAPQLVKMIRAGSGLVIRGKVRCDEYKDTQTHEKKWRNYIQAQEICLADKQKYESEPSDAYEPPYDYQEPAPPPPRHDVRTPPSNQRQPAPPSTRRDDRGGRR
jgi:single-strand DNA-binding protein